MVSYLRALRGLRLVLGPNSVSGIWSATLLGLTWRPGYARLRWLSLDGVSLRDGQLPQMLAALAELEVICLEIQTAEICSSAVTHPQSQLGVALSVAAQLHKTNATCRLSCCHA